MTKKIYKIYEIWHIIIYINSSYQIYNKYNIHGISIWYVNIKSTNVIKSKFPKGILVTIEGGSVSKLHRCNSNCEIQTDTKH
jgi:hypothetical protein